MFRCREFPCNSDCTACAFTSVFVDQEQYTITDPLLEMIVLKETPVTLQSVTVTLPTLVNSNPLVHPNTTYITRTLIFRNISTTVTQTLVASPGTTIFNNLPSLLLGPTSTAVLKSVGNIWFRIV